jgi:hypothetical protein
MNSTIKSVGYIHNLLVISVKLLIVNYLTKIYLIVVHNAIISHNTMSNGHGPLSTHF